MIRQVKRVTDDPSLQEGVAEYLNHDSIPLEAENNLRSTINDIMNNHAERENLEGSYADIVENMVQLSETRWKQTVYATSPPDVMDTSLIGGFAYEAHNYLESEGLTRGESADIINSAIIHDLPR